MLKDLALLNPIIAPAIGPLGVAVGGWTAHQNHRYELRQQLLQRKLEEFYGPRLALRHRLKAELGLGLRISQIPAEQWPKKGSGVRDPADIEKIRRPELPAYERDIEYDNRERKEEALPGFPETYRIFFENMYLAKPCTGSQVAELVNFIEVWERRMQESLAAKVLLRLDHSEAQLHPFHEDLEKRFASLQREVAGS